MTHDSGSKLSVLGASVARCTGNSRRGLLECTLCWYKIPVLAVSALLKA